MSSGISPGVDRAGVVAYLLVPMALGACGLGTSLDGYATGADASSDAYADGSAGGEAASGPGGSSGQGGAGGGDSCGNGPVRCASGRLQKFCRPGQWETIDDCAANDRLCDSLSGACVAKCHKDDDCDQGAEPWKGKYCRKDGRCAPKVFETVWEVKVGGLTITLPFYDVGPPKSKCDFKILWGDEAAGTSIDDGEAINNCTRDDLRTHEYKKAGTYSVKIVGIYDGWGWSASSEQVCRTMEKLRKVESFGPVGLTRHAFSCTKNLVFPEVDVPDASKWTDAAYMFYKSLHNSPVLANWDTSNVTDMLGMFELASAFNQPLATWNTSRVAKMSRMFFDAQAFDQDLSDWLLKDGVELRAMFEKSGMSRANYCKLTKLPGWRDNVGELGISFECD